MSEANVYIHIVLLIYTTKQAIMHECKQAKEEGNNESNIFTTNKRQPSAISHINASSKQ